MRLKQPCLAAGRAEQVVAKRVAEQGVAADGLRPWEVAVAALLASPKAAWNMRGIDSGTGPQLNAMPLDRRFAPAGPVPLAVRSCTSARLNGKHFRGDEHSAERHGGYVSSGVRAAVLAATFGGMSLVPSWSLLKKTTALGTAAAALVTFGASRASALSCVEPSLWHRVSRLMCQRTLWCGAPIAGGSARPTKLSSEILMAQSSAARRRNSRFPGTRC
jgi:hypothetical protein